MKIFVKKKDDKNISYIARNSNIPHIEKIELLKDNELIKILDLIENSKEIILKIENTQIRRLWEISQNFNFNYIKIEEYLNHQIERNMSESKNNFYNMIKENLEKYKDDKRYIKTYFYEILLYKKSLKENK